MADIETIIKELAEPITDELGIEFLGVVLSGSKETKLVRVVVDAKGGVGVEALRSLSKGLSLQLDVEDLIPGKYHLEISSPGFDWPLKDRKDFERYEGDWLKIVFEDDRRAVEGENLMLNDAGDLLIKNEKGEHLIHLGDTKRIVRTVNWAKVSGAGNSKVKRGKANAKKKS